MPAASILTPVYNRSDDLRTLLDALAAQRFRDFEVVVVDDGSDPAVDSVLDPAAFDFPLRILRNDENKGIGYSRNRAWKAAEGALLIWLDSDAYPCESDWLEGHVQVHRDGLPALGIETGTPFILHSRVREAGTPTLASTAFRFSNWHTSCQDAPYRAVRHHVPTNNTSLPRSLMDQVGPFDPAFEVAEDIDWGHRALEAGIPTAYTPGMPVFHRDPETFSEVWRSYRKMGRFAAQVRQKHPATPNAWLYPRSPVLAALWAVPMALMISLYSTWSWFPTEPRVILHFPFLLYANLANAVGMLDHAQQSRRA